MKNKFAERLKELREEKGFNIIQLAKEVGFSANAISRWERSLRIPNAETIFILCEYFCCSADFLIGLRDD